MQPTIWEALNEPVIEVSPEAAKNIIAVAAMIMVMAWVAPYWGSAGRLADYDHEVSVGMVAGETIGESIEDSGPVSLTTPEWYYNLSRTTEDFVDAYSSAASQTLDVSEPVVQAADFLAPGVSAVAGEFKYLLSEPQF